MLHLEHSRHFRRVRLTERRHLPSAPGPWYWTCVASESDAYLEAFLGLVEPGDLFLAIERIYEQPDPEAAASTFSKLAKRLYAERKSVSQAIAMSRAGIQYRLSSNTDAPE